MLAEINMDVFMTKVPDALRRTALRGAVPPHELVVAWLAYSFRVALSFYRTASYKGLLRKVDGTEHFTEMIPALR